MGKLGQKSYSEELKWCVVQEVLKGKYSKEEARRLYEIKSKSAILEWIRIYSGEERRPQKNKGVEEMPSIRKSDKEQQLEARISQLEKELYIAKHKAIFNETIVELAEEKFGIEIRKKFGAKQFSELKQKGK